MEGQLIRICHATVGHSGFFWPMMAAGTLGCIAHCTGVCLLCLSGGMAAGSSNAFRLATRHILPALLTLDATLFFRAGGLT